MLFWSDNTQVCQMINTGRSTSVRCMKWIREMFWVCVVYNIDLSSSHIRTEVNIVPDFLSRLFDPRRTGIAPSGLLYGLCCCRDGEIAGETT